MLRFYKTNFMTVLCLKKIISDSLKNEFICAFHFDFFNIMEKSTVWEHRY